MESPSEIQNEITKRYVVGEVWCKRETSECRIMQGEMHSLDLIGCDMIRKIRVKYYSNTPEVSLYLLSNGTKRCYHTKCSYPLKVSYPGR